jgi:hypothetical protein
MKRILMVLALVLLSSMLFAQAEPVGPLADPDPAGPPTDPAGHAYSYQNMYWYWWNTRLQEPPESPNRFAIQARLGDPEKEPEALQTREEPQRTQERSGDCDSDCDGEPDQDRVREQLQDGSCEDGGDGPDQDRTRSGQKQ